MNFFQRRRIRKRAYETIRHATHLENMRGDLIGDDDRQRIEDAKNKVRADLTSHDAAALEISIGELYQVVAELSPTYRFAGIRENLEIFVVAIVVAMGFRSYFLQPFKIPTGSMEPTLYGIHSEAVDDPTAWDRAPLKYAKWIITGRMYHEIRVSASGQLSYPQQGGQNHPASVFYYVGTKRYKVPRYASLNYRPGEFIQMGSILWSGSITAGDHVFVNKVAWNFRKPRRGEIMVFDTENIPTLPPGTHYIKRMVGLPTEKVSISPPDLMINGESVREPEGIRRIADQDEGYWGYRVRPESEILSSPQDSITLADDEYFALGDNTLNSRDGRYWGAVPEKNLVGPALLIYWPFSKRWGLAR